MTRRRRSALALSGEHAQQAIAILVQEGKLKASEVGKALQRRDRLIKALRASLSALEQGVGRLGRQFKDSPFPMASRWVKPANRKRVRRKPRISAATRKIYQQQGRYMAALRNLSKQQRATIKAIREKSGVRTAIAAAKQMAR
jgi:hypothetical protein